MNDKVIKKTQDTLGKIIKKPPMTEKLLNRPPFRFLHDVITSVIKTTGFMKGLFEDSELSSENIKDKDSKIAFLQKALDIVSMVLGKQINARPSKIVAGHEPERTNEFLQALADAVNKNVDNEEYVSKVLGGEKGDAKGDAKPPSASKKDRSRDKERETSSDRRKRKDKEEKGDRKSSADDAKRSRSKDDRKDRDRSRDKKDRDSAKDRDKDSGKENKKEEKDRDSGKDRDKERDSGKDKDRQKDREEREKKRREEKEKRKEKEPEKEPPTETEAEAETMVNGNSGENDEDHPARMPRPTSAKGSRRRHKDGRIVPSHKDEEDDEEQRLRDEKQKQEDSDVNSPGIGEDDLPPQVSAARKLARPSSARPAPPRIKKQDAVDNDEQARVGSGKPVSNLIVDDGQNSDDDDTFMVEESAPQPELLDEPPPTQEVEDTGEHGGLVKKILETKKELESGSQKSQPRKQEIEKPLLNDATRRKEREMVEKEIGKLRASIQTLTRSANPLGKIMDYVQEDLDSMQKELAMWRKENKQHAQALKAEQSITESSIEPLKQQLDEVDQAIADQLDLIAASKHNILRNDEKIGKMLGSVTKS